MSKNASRRKTEPQEKVIRPSGSQSLYEFHELGADRFEELCCALWSTEPDVVLPDLHGRKRQRQFGIDVLADRRAGDGIEGISCKCYKSLSKGEIADFSDEFLDHWESHWKAKNFRRFILCVACDVSAHERRREIEKETARFAALGVKYEVWSRRRLSNKLHPQTGIRLAFGFQHESELVTQQLAQLDRRFVSALAAVSTPAPTNELLSALDAAIAKQLNGLRDLLRAGDTNTVRSELAAISSHPQWTSLGSTTRARVLRMRALQLIDEEPDQALTLLDEADALAAEPDARSRALLTFRTRGPRAALDLLLNATSTEGQLLRVALLIESEQLPEAESELERLRSGCSDDPEWHRLYAFVASLTGRTQLAIEAVERAEQLAPSWIIVQEAAGRLHFSAALPATHVRHVRAFPEPSDCELVRQDEVARQHLVKALAHFEAVLRLDRGSRSEGRTAFWCLACRICLPDRREEASAQCAALLSDPRTRPQAVPWAIYAHFPMDHQGIIRALEQTLRENHDALESLQALVLCALAHGDPKKAAAALKRFRAKTRDTEALAVVDLWEARVAMYRGEVVPDDARLDATDRMQRLAARSATTGDWGPLIRFLSEGTFTPGELYFGCKLLAANQQWGAVAPHLERLLRELETHSVVRLAAYVWYHTRAFDRVVAVLTEKTHVFSSAVLPYDVQRLKAYAAAGRGDLTTARAVANSLLARSGSLRDRQFAIELALRVGDVAGATALLRESLGHKSLTPKQVLRYLPSVATEEPELARQIVRELLSRTLDHEIGGALIEWSYRLGLDAELAPLWQQISVANAQVFGMRSVTLEEIQELLRKQRANAERLSTAYQRGEGPIHVVASALNINLAVLWDDAFERGDTTLFIRSGNRPRQFFESSIPYIPRLVLDLTAILTCEHLDIWDDLIRCGCGIVLPHGTVLGILELEQTVRHNQPKRIDTQRQTKLFVETGKLKVEEAAPIDIEGKACVVFQQNIETTMPRLSLGALASYLIDAGRADPEIRERIRNRQSFKEQFCEIELASIRDLHFEMNTIEELVDVGLFEAAVSEFSLHTERDYVAMITAEIGESNRREAIAERLKRLRQRIRTSIENGTIDLLPEPRAEDVRESDERTLVLSLLRELLVMPTTEHAWLWIDDRYCTSYTGANGNHIVSTLEVLDLMLAREVIGAERHYSLIHRLRKARCHFLPLDVAEVAHAIGKAPIKSGQVVETPGLHDLRRSFNHFLHNDSWPRFETSNDRKPEFACLLSAYGLMRSTLEEIWGRERLTSDVKRAWSDWVWRSLRVEYLPRLPVGGSDEHRLKMWRLSLVHLLLIGMSISIRSDNGQTRRAFFDWMQTVVSDLTERGDPQTQSLIADDVLDTLLKHIWHSAQEDRNAEERLLISRIMRAYVAALPPVVQELVLGNAELRDVIGLRHNGTIELRQFKFGAEAFWTALAEIREGETRSISTIEDQQFVLKVEPAGFSLVGPENFRLADEVFGVLSESTEQRREALKRFADELSADDRERICAEPVPAARMRLLEEAREASTPGRYALITKRLAGDFDARILRPASVTSHAAYLGIDVDADVIDWNLAANRLAQECDEAEALHRLAGLPIRLSPTVRERLSTRSRSEIAWLVDTAGSQRATPLRLLQLLDYCTGRPDMADQAAPLVVRVLKEWRERASAFIAALKWSERTWKEDKEWHRLSVGARLALVWSHADRVLESLLAGGVPVPRIVRALSRMDSHGLRFTLPLDPEYERDAASPNWMGTEILLLQGLGGLQLDGELHQQVRESFFELVSRVHAGDKRLATIHMFEDRRFGSNALGSYLAQPIEPWLHTLYEDDRLVMVRPEARDEVRRQSIDLARDNIRSGMTWVQVTGTGFQWYPAEDRVTMEESIRNFHFPKDSASKDDAIAITCLARAIPFLSEAVREEIRVRVHAWAQRLRETHHDRIVELNGSSSASKDAMLVVEIFTSLARQRASDLTYRELARSAQESAEAWPALARIWRPLFDRLFSETPSHETQPIWHQFVLMRAYR